MFEVFEVYTGEVIHMTQTESGAWDYIYNEFSIPVGKDYDVRLAEDRWPEYESVMEMEKWQ
jgi:hypothetical protein